jgi:hypothetical protein
MSKPNDKALVEAVVDKFESSYFDGSIDFKGSIYHMMNGEPVRMGANFIFYRRDHSDAAVKRAMGILMAKYPGNFQALGIAELSVEKFRKGGYMSVQLIGDGNGYGRYGMQEQIQQILNKLSDRAAPEKSKTAASVFISHDDGYSRTNGSGYSAVNVEI